jgi:nitrate/nitrite transporter NarK
VMFTVLTLASAVPVLLVALAGSLKSYPLLLVFGFFLGLAGTTFAVGVPFVNAWFEPRDGASQPASSAPAWAAPPCRPSSLCA